MDKSDNLHVIQPLTNNFSTIVKSLDEVKKKTELETQRALDETGFGKFNYKVIIVSGLICMNVAFSITGVGFILPSAACDFSMNTIDKGRLSTAPILGMLCGSCLWGCIADTNGRRMSLLNCLFLQAILECVASIISSYTGFLILKFLSGVALTGELAVLYTYVGEFQPTNYRQRILSFMEIPWVLGVILSPIFAWLIIPLDVELKYSGFSFKSWNLFVFMCSLPSLITGLWLLKFPETPKYLAEMGMQNHLRKVLTSMYIENTGRQPEEFIARLDAVGITILADLEKKSGNIDTFVENRRTTLRAFIQFFKSLYHQTWMLLKPPYIGRTIITCLGSYCILAPLYSLMLWFPELFQRFADFEEQHPGVKTSVCIVSKSINQHPESNQTANNSILLDKILLSEISSSSECISTLDSQVYVYTLILGLACIPLAIIFPVFIKHLGFRFYLVFSSLTCCAVTLGLIFVTSSTQNLILSCIFEGLISVCATVMFCLVVELFPTNLRATASALSSVFGRTGALIGNTMFGYLIDAQCFVLICIIAGELFIAGLLGFFVPKEGGKLKQDTKTDLRDTKNVSHAEKYVSVSDGVLP